MEAFSDRRRESRFSPATQLTARVGFPNEPKIRPEECRILNVSDGGLSFVYRRLIGVGTVVKVEYQGCELVGIVRNVRLREFGSQTECIAGVEISQFVQHEEVWLELVKHSRKS